MNDPRGWSILLDGIRKLLQDVIGSPADTGGSVSETVLGKQNKILNQLAIIENNSKTELMYGRLKYKYWEQYCQSSKDYPFSVEVTGNLKIHSVETLNGNFNGTISNVTIEIDGTVHSVDDLKLNSTKSRVVLSANYKKGEGTAGIAQQVDYAQAMKFECKNRFAISGTISVASSGTAGILIYYEENKEV